VGQSRELLAFLTAVENHSRIKVISAPSVLASDNQTAHIEVGTSIPILTSVGYTGAQQTGGGSIFTNSISQQETGVLLTVSPRVNSGGMVTMAISQTVSVPGAPPSTAIPSPTIQNREVDTQVSVEDGQTIALGGIIQETKTLTTNRIPLLGDIPWLGVLFGSTSSSTTRTELIVLITPHVIRTRHEADQMSDELKHTIKLASRLLSDLPAQTPQPKVGSQLVVTASPGNPAANPILNFTVTGTGRMAAPGGAVNCKVDGVASSQAVAIISGTGTWTLSGLTAGPHEVACTYSGDNDYPAAAAPSITVTVPPAPPK
jgi:type II secretory pathway component GspD/PulD (secretin)